MRDAAARGESWLPRAMGLAAFGALAAFAYRRLLSFKPERSLPDEFEQWFFVPTESLTPLVLGLALWLLFRRKARMQALPEAPGSLRVGALLLSIGVALHAWATYTAATDLLLPSLAVNALACAWLWRGVAALRVVWLPVAFLLIAMLLPAPLRNEVVYQLQTWTAELAGRVLYLGGVSHLVAAERIVRPEAAFSVIESCSGMRSMETLSMVAVLMMDLFRRRGLHALIVVAAAPPVAFLWNALRAVLLILNPYSGIASIHVAQGVAILLGGLVVLFLLDGLLVRAIVGREPAPVSKPERRAGAGHRAAWAAAAIALGCAAPVSWFLPPWAPPSERIGSFVPFLTEQLGESEALDYDRIFLGTTIFRDVGYRRYARPGADVVLFVGTGDRARREWSVLSPKNAVPGSGWVVESVEPVTSEAGLVDPGMQVVRAGPRRELVLHWYENAGPRWIEVLRSLFAIDRSPWGMRANILVVRVEVPLRAAGPEGVETAREQLQAFIQELRPALDTIKQRVARDTLAAVLPHTLGPIP